MSDWERDNIRKKESERNRDNGIVTEWKIEKWGEKEWKIEIGGERERMREKDKKLKIEKEIYRVIEERERDREMERDKEREREWKREIDRECLCVTKCEREKDIEREKGIT